MRRLLLLTFLVLAACAEPGGPGTEGSGSGIAGRVIAFPSCPVLTETTPCPRKTVQTLVAIESAAGEQVVRVRTEPGGTFRVDLDPGDYLLSAQPPPSAPHLVPRPATAKVEPDTYVRVTVILDTRLREP
jgi:hypothetical protein